jgi:hypothetical protein
MAIEPVIISLVAGIVLGLRYKVFVLVPAIAVAAIFAVIIGVVSADGFWSIVLAMAVLGTAVQLGYVMGVFVRAAIRSICLPMIGGHKPELNSDIRMSN